MAHAKCYTQETACSFLQFFAVFAVFRLLLGNSRVLGAQFFAVFAVFRTSHEVRTI